LWFNLTYKFTMKKDVKLKRAKLIGEKLNQLYPRPPIPLEHKDPYTLLIAVLLSAQCTDQRVNKITPALFALADTPEKMALKTVAEVDAIVRPCGLTPRKAESIVKLSQILVEKHGGMVPQNFADLEALPGVGHKTASVVMIQAFGHPAFPVDTHIHRLAERWGLSNGKSVAQTELDLKQLFPQDYWGVLHLQIIYYGREYCPARGHRVESCPLCSMFAEKKMLRTASTQKGRKEA